MLNVKRLMYHLSCLTPNILRLTPYVPFAYKLFRSLFDPKGQTTITPDGIGGENSDKTRYQPRRG